MNFSKNKVFKYCLASFVFMCLLSIQINAQTISKTVIDKYSPAIIVRVFDVVSKTNISDSIQEILAAKFDEQDVNLLKLIKEKKPQKLLDSIRMDLQEDWLNILTAKQQYYYSIAIDKERSKTKYWFTQFSFALQNKDTLKLRTEIADSMFLYIDALNKMKNTFKKKNPGQWFESKAYESEAMTRLLSEEQYTLLLTLKNYEKAKSSAMKDWDEVEVRKIANAFNKEIEIKRLTEYYVEKQNTFDRYAHDKIKQNAVLKYVYDNKPRILNALIKARRTPGNDTQGVKF